MVSLFLIDMCNTWFSSYKFNFYCKKQYSFDYPKPFVFASTIGNVRDKRTQYK